MSFNIPTYRPLLPNQLSLLSVRLSPLLLLLSILLSSACSIKENRSACPCHLILDVSGLSGERFDTLEVLLQNGAAPALRSRWSLLENGDGLIRMDVSKQWWDLNVCAMENGSLWLSDSQSPRMLIPPGQQCPPLYLYARELDATGEELVERVVLHKSFCTLHIRMLEADPSQPYPFSLRISGDVDGYDSAGKPREGRFDAAAYPTQAGECSVRVPRQKDDSLELLLREGEETIATFALGRYIVSGGYDWNAPDLEDVQVSIDCAALSLHLQVKNWTETYHFDVEI
ncbi:MAG: hypothetical protein J6Y32_04540 [Bacteroidales bacterium]|nr:hypothetical protein [Bacteroidales bacterium]